MVMFNSSQPSKKGQIGSACVGYLVDLALFGVLLEHLVEVVEGSRVVVVGARHLGELV